MVLSWILLPIFVRNFMRTLFHIYTNEPFPTFVVDEWLSFSALFLSYLLYSVVNISNYKAQNNCFWQPEYFFRIFIDQQFRLLAADCTEREIKMIASNHYQLVKADSITR